MAGTKNAGSVSALYGFANVFDRTPAGIAEMLSVYTLVAMHAQNSYVCSSCSMQLRAISKCGGQFIIYKISLQLSLYKEMNA